MALIFFIMDGLGDLPTPKTPLQAAKKPNIDRLAAKSITGMLHPIAPYIVPGSDTSHLQLFGYDPFIFYSGRGPLEALGIGMDLQDGDVAFRANLATVKNGMVADRRAGRISTEEAKKFEKYLSMRIEDVEAVYQQSVEHRGAVVFRGKGLRGCVTDTDPHRTGVEPWECHPTDESAEAKKTARITNKYAEAVRKKLAGAPENKGRKKPANALLLRGAGCYKKVPYFEERFRIRAACVAGGALYRGVCRYLAMDIILVPGDTGDKRTNLKAKGKAVLKALEKYDMVFLHVKATDSFSHDGDFEGKKKMIERIDRELMPMLIKSSAAMVITGDHTTPVSVKEHTGHPVPVLVHAKGERCDKVKKFDEISCAQGGLGNVRGKEIIRIIQNILGKSQKYGS